MGGGTNAAKQEAVLDAQRPVMHSIGHVAFTQQQSDVLKQVYKKEARSIRLGNTITSGGSTLVASSDNVIKEKTASLQNSITDEENTILRDGTSREGTGRAEYLRLQHKKSPKTRFKAPMTSAQVYGWDSDLSRFTTTPHSRKAVLRNTCERTRGVFNPDL
ncbi:hypothetical protein DIPPA_20164 [Diplonema papillatum]|nr:hypothetical protein DIPPA_20164 [Diplonema papillatum]